MNKVKNVESNTNNKVRGLRYNNQVVFDYSCSPYYEACDNSSPGGTAGIRPFGFFIQLPPAAAQTQQVHCQKQQAQTKTHSTNACKKYQRLKEKEDKKEFKYHLLNMCWFVAENESMHCCQVLSPESKVIISRVSLTNWAPVDLPGGNSQPLSTTACLKILSRLTWSCFVIKINIITADCCSQQQKKSK